MRAAEQKVMFISTLTPCSHPHPSEAPVATCLPGWVGRTARVWSLVSRAMVPSTSMTVETAPPCIVP